MNSHCTALDLAEKPASYNFTISGESRVKYAAAPKQAARGLAPVAEGAQEKAQGRATPGDEASHPQNSWWQRFSCDVNASDYFIALFTLILAIVTGFLWWTTHRLWKSGEGQIAAAIKAAEAADLSAKAAVGVEIARMAMEKVTIPNLSPTSWDVPQVKIGVRWVNLGRTDGVVVHDCLAYCVRPSLDPNPEYPTDTVHDVPSTMIVKPEGHFKCERDFRLTAEQISEVTAGTARLWVYGYIDFLDFLNRANRVGFCRVAELKPNPMYPTMGQIASFTYGGPKSYTYSRTLD